MAAGAGRELASQRSSVAGGCCDGDKNWENWRSPEITQLGSQRSPLRCQQGMDGKQGRGGKKPGARKNCTGASEHYAMATVRTDTLTPHETRDRDDTSLHARPAYELRVLPSRIAHSVFADGTFYDVHMQDPRRI